MWKFLIWALIIFLAYKVIKNIVGFLTGPKEERGRMHGRQEQKRYGETTINRSQDRSSKDSDDEGEYIDYKEIKD